MGRPDKPGDDEQEGVDLRSVLILVAFLLLIPGTGRAIAPQSPIAAGPLGSILEVIQAAHRCGVYHLRLEMAPAEGVEEARLFLAQDPPAAAGSCLVQWTTAAGKRLHLSPRWLGDKFN
jgi:hypothetical protein